MLRSLSNKAVFTPAVSRLFFFVQDFFFFNVIKLDSEGGSESTLKAADSAVQELSPLLSVIRAWLSKERRDG